MNYYSHSYRDYTERNCHSSRRSNRFDRTFSSTRDTRDIPRYEREYVYHQRQGGFGDPYGTERRRSGRHAPIGHMYAADNSERRHRHSGRRQSNVDDLTYGSEGLNMSNGHSRSGRDRNVHRHDDYMPEAPAAPRNWPRNGEYYLDRALRPHNSARDNYNDAYQYMHGERPHRHSTSNTRHDPREYAGLNLRFGVDNTKHHDPSDTFRDRIRRWF